MPRREVTVLPDGQLVRRCDTGRRTIDLPLDMLGRERLTIRLDDRSVERRAEGISIGFKGHAAVFDSRTWIGPSLWGFWEEVAPGAFAKTIGEADVRFLVNHDPNLVLARNTAGTLRLDEDDVGLAVDADMAPVSYAMDLAMLLERGDVSQMSFAFEAIRQEWQLLDDDSELRRLLEVRLYDVSVVTYPAFAATDAALRAAGFDRITRALELDDDARVRLLAADADEEILPMLRAASPAPAAEAEPDPPAPATGATPDGRHRRLSLLAAELSLG